MDGGDWRDQYKSLEIGWHQLKDDYSELARTLGMAGDPFWGDPLDKHAAVLARARACKAAYDVLTEKDAA